jgi:hypothetical protein
VASSGITSVIDSPSRPAIQASAMPVLPLVASTSRSPARTSPRSSAPRTMP